MKNKNTVKDLIKLMEDQIIESRNHRLIRIDAQKRLVEKMIKDLEKQFFTLNEDWDETWRERQQYINEREEKLAASK